MRPYVEFRNESLLYLKEIGVKLLKISNEERRRHFIESDSIIITRWVKEKKFEGLVSWATENFDTNCGDEQILQINRALIKFKEVELLKKLWSKIIKNRREHYNTLKRYYSKDVTSARMGLEFAMHTYINSLKKLNQYLDADNISKSLTRLQKKENK